MILYGGDRAGPGSILHDFDVLDFLQGVSRVEIESIKIVTDIGADFEKIRRLLDMLKGFTIRTRCAEGGPAGDVDVYGVGSHCQGEYFAGRWNRASPGEINPFEIKKEGW